MTTASVETIIVDGISNALTIFGLAAGNTGVLFIGDVVVAGLVSTWRIIKLGMCVLVVYMCVWTH